MYNVQGTYNICIYMYMYMYRVHYTCTYIIQCILPSEDSQPEVEEENRAQYDGSDEVWPGQGHTTCRLIL